MMKASVRELDRLDAFLALFCGVGALAVYLRTMAPDVLYGDSAELQTLAYTMGHTHSTGYPIYLFLARLVGSLPLYTPAWRVTLFSGLMAALAVTGVVLLSRSLTNSRAGACLAGLGLAFSYTMWSQAIITEVYTPAAAFLAWILVLVLFWQQNLAERAKWLFVAALLAGLSLGMHATTALAALPAAGFVPLWLASQRASRAEWRRSLLSGVGGALLGVMIWLAAFLYIDWNNPPSSFINVVLSPSRSIWDLTAQDIDTPLERIALTLNSVQWKDVLFEGGAGQALGSLVEYLGGILTREFSVLFLLLGIYGGWVLISRSIWRGGYLLASYGFVLFFVLNYRPGDQYVFFLSTYVPLSAAVGVGIGTLIEKFAQSERFERRGWGQAAAIVTSLILFAVLLLPGLAGRLSSIQTGVASFVQEDYQFPVENLREPRQSSQMRLRSLPDDALVLMDWRDLYSMAYLAHVEGEKPGLLFSEAMPRGNNGKIAASLVETIHLALDAGRPVMAAQRYPGLQENFRLEAAANGYVQLFQKALSDDGPRP